jgi:2-polyprenyl-3-methyl-5-hydroxy-6-metoxy-1,4-benzoquinol methylase
MLTTKQKINYLLDSTLRFFEQKKCPHCKSTNCTKIDQKYFVTQLLQCNNCNFRFRHPYDSINTNKDFYQKEYFEDDVMTTDMPTNEQLEDMKSNNFDIDNDKSIKRLLPLFDIVTSNNRNAKIVDYGASWGYMSYQFKLAGYDVQSFEISKPRGNYGNKNLGLNIVSNIEELKGGVDIFFSSHVIEHVPSITEMLNVAKGVLKKGGFFICLCPNGSDEFRKLDPQAFHLAWGKVHPNYLDEKFFSKLFEENNYYIGATPINLEKINNWNSEGQCIDKLESIELLTIVKL